MHHRDPADKSPLEQLAPLVMAFRRYWKVAVSPALAIAVVGGVISWKLPSYYSADTRIFIQPQRINSKLFEEREKDEVQQQLEALTQEIISRPKLRMVLEKYTVYPQFTGIQGEEAALKKIRNEIQVTPAESKGGARTVNTFQLAFSHRDPKIAYQVTNELADLFIEESVVNQRSEVQGAEEFFDSQLVGAKRQLEEMENKRQEFIRANFGKLPEHLDQATTRLQMLASQLETNARLLEANLARRSNLESELAEVRKLPLPSSDMRALPDTYDPQDRLNHLESALVVLKSRYSDQHPDVIKARNQIQALKEEMSRGKSGGAVKNSASAGQAVSSGSAQLVLGVKRQIGEVEVQLLSLREEKKQLQETIATLEKNIGEMPIKEQELLKINRDYDSVRKRYDELAAAKQDANLQSSLIKSQKGLQFRVVEPAELPIVPAGPPRNLLYLGSVAAFFATVLALPLLIFLVNGSFKSKDAIEQELGIQVLGVIPPMSTPEAASSSKKMGLRSFLISAVTAGVASLVVLVVL